MMNRREFLRASSAALVLPAIVSVESLMPVRALTLPYGSLWTRDDWDKFAYFKHRIWGNGVHEAIPSEVSLSELMNKIYTRPDFRDRVIQITAQNGSVLIKMGTKPTNQRGRGL